MSVASEPGDEPPPTPAQNEREAPAEGSLVGRWVGRGARAIARLWVAGLLVAAAVCTGVALNQMFAAEAELNAMRRASGPDAYALVAYRRELERQLEEYRRTGYATVTPTPPARPRLLEEIDIARARNEALAAARAEAGAGQRRGAGAPTPVIRAPD